MAKRTASTKGAAGRKPARKSSSTKSPSPSKAGGAKNGTVKSKKAGESEVTIERRIGDRRSAAPAASLAPPLERREKVNRRRQIDPTTCERDYSDDEVEFMNALDVYKRKNGRMFPTCSEVLEVIRGLGYSKQSMGGSSVERTPTRTYANAFEDLEAATRELAEAL